MFFLNFFAFFDVILGIMPNLAFVTLAANLVVILGAECLHMCVTCHAPLFYADWLRALLYTADLAMTLIAKTGAFGKKKL